MHPCAHYLAQIVALSYKKVGTEGSSVVAGFFCGTKEYALQLHRSQSFMPVLPITVHYKGVYLPVPLAGHQLNFYESHSPFIICFSQRLIWDVRFMLYLLPANRWHLGLLSRQPRSAEKLVEDMVTLPVSYRHCMHWSEREWLFWCVLRLLFFYDFWILATCLESVLSSYPYFKILFHTWSHKRKNLPKPVQDLHQHLDRLYK